MLERVGKPPLHARELQVVICYQLVRSEMEKVTLTNYGKTALRVVKLGFAPRAAEQLPCCTSSEHISILVCAQ